MRINPKTGLPYVTGVSFAEQNKWIVTVKESFNAIRSDPDLKPYEKAQAIRLLQTKLDSLIDSNSEKERLDLLNKLYQRKHGVLANQTTPMADFIRSTILKRGKF